MKTCVNHTSRVAPPGAHFDSQSTKGLALSMSWGLMGATTVSRSRSIHLLAWGNRGFTTHVTSKKSLHKITFHNHTENELARLTFYSATCLANFDDTKRHAHVKGRRLRAYVILTSILLSLYYIRLYSHTYQSDSTEFEQFIERADASKTGLPASQSPDQSWPARSNFHPWGMVKMVATICM